MGIVVETAKLKFVGTARTLSPFNIHILTRYGINIAVCMNFNIIHISRLYEANMEIILK